MTLQIGDRVYHKKKMGNGIIIDIDSSKSIHKYVVEYIWGKYVNANHGEWKGFSRKEKKWEFCSERNLIKVNIPKETNKVTMIGTRSLDKLIQNVCEIPHRIYGDGSDIILTYGHYKHKLPNNILVLNRRLISNKLIQCQILKDIAPASTNIWWKSDWFDLKDFLYDDCIVKPYFSLGGRRICEYNSNHNYTNKTHYLQIKFPKVREFRVYCFLWGENKTPYINEKIIKNKDQLCWNEKQGSVFRVVYQDGNDNVKYANTLSGDYFNTLRDLSVECLKRLKYDFGGVDIAVDENDNFIVFEVNSRMGIKERGLFSFKKKIMELRTLNINEYVQNRWR